MRKKLTIDVQRVERKWRKFQVLLGRHMFIEDNATELYR